MQQSQETSSNVLDERKVSVSVLCPSCMAHLVFDGHVDESQLFQIGVVCGRCDKKIVVNGSRIPTISKVFVE